MLYWVAKFYEQFWIKTGSNTLVSTRVSAKVAEILVETCFCQDGLNLGLNPCWQKLGNPVSSSIIRDRGRV